MSADKPTGSPRWSATGKRTVIIILAILTLLLLYRIRLLLVPITLATLLAYLIEPGVKFISKRTPLNRAMAILGIYLVLLIIMISIPVTVATPVFNQGSLFVRRVPEYLEGLGLFFSEPIVLVEGYEIPVDQLPLDQTFASLSANLIDLVQTLGGQTITIFGSVASATVSTVAWIILILIMSMYLVKDHNRFFDLILNLIPASYHQDIVSLSNRINLTWNAFLRGQLLLCLLVGVIVFVTASIIGLPNASSLAIFAGFMELIPTFGPILAAIPAVLIAIFQSDASWLGSLMTPFWFGLLVFGIYALIYQFENYMLVPRIIGYHLKLHPLVVLVGVVAGASIAGIFGILIAAPVLASARLFLRYIYDKLLDRPPFPEEDSSLAAVGLAVHPSERPKSETSAAKADSQDNSTIEFEQP